VEPGLQGTRCTLATDLVHVDECNIVSLCSGHGQLRHGSQSAGAAAQAAVVVPKVKRHAVNDNQTHLHAHGRPPVLGLRCMRSQTRALSAIQDCWLAAPHATEGSPSRSCHWAHILRTCANSLVGAVPEWCPAGAAVPVALPRLGRGSAECQSGCPARTPASQHRRAVRVSMLTPPPLMSSATSWPLLSRLASVALQADSAQARDPSHVPARPAGLHSRCCPAPLLLEVELPLWPAAAVPGGGIHQQWCIGAVAGLHHWQHVRPSARRRSNPTCGQPLADAALSAAAPAISATLVGMKDPSVSM